MFRPLNRTYFHIVLIGTIGLLAYSNTFDVPFQWDGVGKVADNQIVKDLWYFINPVEAEEMPHYVAFKRRFIGYLTFALNYTIHGRQVFGYHVVNIAIHILNAFLVYCFTTLAFRAPPLQSSSMAPCRRQIALCAALLFVAHPLQTQAVTYLVQRLTSLAVMFYLLSLVAYVSSRISFRRRAVIFFYSLSLFSAALAMKTKEIAFTIPFIIAMFEFVFLRDTLKKRFIRLAPFFLLAAIIPIVLIRTSGYTVSLSDSIFEAMRLQTDVSRADYLCTQARVIITYIRLLLLPVGQNLDYDYPVCGSLMSVGTLASVLMLIALLSAGMFLFLRAGKSDAAMRLAAFGLFWFFITLTIESSIIPIADVIQEHRVYLPGIGFILALTSTAFLTLCKGGDKTRKVSGLVFILAVVALTAGAMARNAVWRSQVSLWRDVALKSPAKVRPHNNLGRAYFEAGMLDEAIHEYKAALGLDLHSVQTLNNLALAYARKSLFKKAIKYYMLALALDPESVDVLNNLGLAHLKNGNLDEAERFFVKARKLERPKPKPRKFDYPDKFEYRQRR